MRISDWSSDVCSSDLLKEAIGIFPGFAEAEIRLGNLRRAAGDAEAAKKRYRRALAIKPDYAWAHLELAICLQGGSEADATLAHYRQALRYNPKLYKTVLFRSEEHTSELQSLMRISYD